MQILALVAVFALFSSDAFAGPDMVYGPQMRKVEDVIDSVFIENNRLVDPKSAESQMFQKVMTQLAQRILPDHDFKAEPIHFFLEDAEAPNAYTFPAGKGQGIIMVFTTGDLADVQNLSELAFTFGHEWTHNELSRTLGPGPNSKGEEYTADIRPLELLHQAKIDIRAVLPYAKRIFKAKKVTISQVVDVHGVDTNRVAAIEKALAVFDNKFGGLKFPVEPAPKELAEIVQQAKHFPFVSQFLRNHRTGLLEKITRLNELFAELEPLYKKRYSDLLNELRVLRQELESTQADTKIDTKTRIALEQLYEKVLGVIETQPEQKNLYVALTGNKPTGRMETLADLVSEFVNADDIDVAGDAADELLAELESEPLDFDFLKRVKFENFKPVSEAKVTRFVKGKGPAPVVAWNQFAGWALQDQTLSIAKALHTLGVDDPRVIKLINDRLTDEEIKSLKRISMGPTKNGRYIHHFVINRSGQAVRMRKLESGGFESLREQAHYQILREQKERYLTEFPKMLEKAVHGDQRARERLEFLLEKVKTHGFTRLIYPELMEVDYDLVYEVNRGAIELVDDELLEKDPHSHPRMTWFKMLKKLFDRDPDKYREKMIQFFEHGVTSLVWFPDLAGYMYKDPDNIFDPRFKLDSLLVSARERNADLGKNRLNDASEHMHLIRKILKYEPPQTYRELKKVMELLWEYQKDLETSEVQLVELKNFFAKRSLSANFYYLSQGIVRSSWDLLDLENHAWFKQKILKTLQLQRVWPKEPVKLAKAWRVFHDSGLLVPAGKVMDTKLQQLLTVRDSVEVRWQVADSLITGDRLQSPQIREQIFNFWVDSVYQRIGKDDLSTAYHDSAVEIVREVKDKLSLVDRIDLYSLLATKIESQQTLSRAIKDLLVDKTRENLSKTQIWGISTESGLEILRQDAKKRQLFIEFLTKPLTKQTLNAFHDDMAVAAGLGLDENGEVIPPADGWLKAYQHFLDNFVQDALTVTVTRAKRTLAARYLYENFWASHFFVRTAVIEDVLLPPHLKNADEIRKVFGYVMDRLFPSGAAYATESRQLIEAYLEIIPEYQRGILLSAMMVSVNQGEGTNVPVGKRLATVLEMMGPAEIKTGQGIHSYPGTPDGLKEGLERLKSFADVPLRWDLMDLYEQQLPRAFKDSVRRVKKILGSASYYVVFDVEMNDGSENVVALLRPYSLERSENGFGLMSKLANRLGKESGIGSALTDMIDQAKQLAAVETSSQLGAKQFATAKRLYDGRQVEVDGTVFTFQSAELVEYGEGYRIMKKAPGSHFAELADSPTKTKLAKAYVLLELANILSGKEFDHDRHGYQMKVEGNQVTLFDFGGMALDVPAPKELALLGQVLGRTLDDQLGKGANKNLAGAFYRQIDLLKKEGVSSDYLTSVQKAILAMGDFFQYLKYSDLVDNLRSLVSHGLVDSQIMSALMSEISQPEKLMELQAGNSHPCNILLK